MKKVLFFLRIMVQKNLNKLTAKPQAALLFPWLDLDRQVKVIGSVEKVTTLESIKYFASRPKDSQLGAWASQQSATISSRSLLDQSI